MCYLGFRIWIEWAFSIIYYVFVIGTERMLMQLIGVRRFWSSYWVGTVGLAWVQVVLDMVLMERRFSVANLKNEIIRAWGVWSFHEKNCMEKGVNCI